MTSKISPFKNHVAIGTVQMDGSVLATQEFLRWLGEQLFPRVGGGTAMTNIELADAISDAAQAPVFIPPGMSPPFTDELLSPSYEPLPASEDPHARLQAAEARLEQLARAIHDLQQGTQL